MSGHIYGSKYRHSCPTPPASNTTRRVLAVLGALIAAFALTLAPTRSVHAATGVEPSTVTLALAEGEATVVDKIVHTPPVPPRPDVLVLADTTGSMGAALAGLKNDLGALVSRLRNAQPDAQVGVAEYRDFSGCDQDEFAYRLGQGITGDVAAVQAAVNRLGTFLTVGCDVPEQQLNALFQIASDSPPVGWRPGSTRIVAWFGDASGHDPSFGHSLPAVIAALGAAHIRVVAVPISTVDTDGLDASGQATAITRATGGTLVATTNPDEVANAILAGIQNLPVVVSPSVRDCDPNLSVAHNPSTRTVTSGTDAAFAETIAVGAGAVPGSTIGCRVDFLLDGALAPGFTQLITEVVPRHPSALHVDDATSDYHDPGTLSGRLVDAKTGAPIAGAYVSFAMAAESCAATTDADGVAHCVIVPQEPAGSYPIDASFAGDGGHLASVGRGTYTVTREETVLTYTGTTHIANGARATLSARLAEEDDATPIAGRAVVFTLGAGSSAQTCTGSTGADGQASCLIDSVSQPADTIDAPLTADFAGDAFYEPASATATLLLQYMTGRAYGVASAVRTLLGDLTVAPLPDTGHISTSQARVTAPPCLVTLTGVVTVEQLCAGVTTLLAPGTSVSTASVDRIVIDTRILGVPVIEANLIRSTSTTTCASSSGNTTIASLRIGGVEQVVASLGPNSTIGIGPLARLIVNEQTPVPGGLTVNAIHLTVDILGQSVDVVVASATSDIHHCA